MSECNQSLEIAVEITKKTQFLWRPPEAVLSRVRELSEEERRSINNQVTVLIEKALENYEKGNKP